MLIADHASPLGRVRLTSDGDAVTGLYFCDPALPPSPENLPVPVIFARAFDWLDRYFAGKTPSGMPPLAPTGTAFRREIWQELLRVPYGETVSYGELARRYTERHGRAMSAQAVGSAVGHNPIALMIPCHRVIGSDGALTGYAWGTERKAALLRLEGHTVNSGRVSE